MLPDVLLALWLKLLTDGVIDGDRQAIMSAAVGLAAVDDCHLVRERAQRAPRAGASATASPSPWRRTSPTSRRPVADDRAPGAPGVPRPAGRAARPGRSRSTTCSCRCSSNVGFVAAPRPHGRAAGVDPPGACCCCCSPGSRPSLTSLWRPASSAASRSRWPPTTAWPATCSSLGTTAAAGQGGAASPASADGCGRDARAERGRVARARSRRPAGVGAVGVARRGRCSASPTSVAIVWVARGSTGASATSCSSSWPGSGCRSTSASGRRARASSAASGSTRRCG